MTIEYDLTKDDLVAFNLSARHHSPTVQRQYMRGWLVPPAIWLFICLAIWLLADSRQATPLKTLRDLLPLFLGAPAYLIYFPYAHRRSMNRTIDGMTSEGKNRGMLGRHRLTLRTEGITEATDVSETTTSWAGIERIAASDSYAFIFISTLGAIVVPRRAFPDAADFDKFFTTATDFRAKATPPPHP